MRSWALVERLLFLALLLFSFVQIGCGGCGAGPIAVVNAPPTAQISSPEDGAVFSEGEEIEFEGLAGDPEQSPDELVIQWVSSADGILNSDPADAQGVLSFATSELSANFHTITLLVTDKRGVGVAATIDLLVNSAPTAEITGPSEGARFDQGANVSLVGKVSDNEEMPSSLETVWTSDQDGVLGTVTPDEDGSVSLKVNSLSSAVHKITLSVTDEADFSASDSRSFVVNTLPAVEITGPDPESGNFFSDNPITLSANATDLEDKAPDLKLVWKSDLDGELGSPVADSNGDSSQLLPGANEEGEGASLSPGTHHLTFTATDSLDGSASDTLVLEVSPPNQPPTQAQIHIDPASPGPDDDLELVFDLASSDPEEEELTYSYSWSKNGNVITFLDGEQIVQAGYTSPGDLWTVTVVVSDPWDSADPVSANAEVRTVDPPTTPEVALTPATPTTSEELSLEITLASVDPNPEQYAISYEVRWFRGQTPMTDFNDTYGIDSLYTRKGDTWAAEVTPVTQYARGETARAEIGVVNSAPSLASAVISPSSGTVETVFSVNTDGWNDPDNGDTEQYTYAWTLDGDTLLTTEARLDQSGCTEDGSCNYVKGASITCVVTPTDGETEGASVTSAPVVISNTPPTFSSVTVEPTVATEETTLTAYPVGFSDIDGDAEQPYLYQWYVNLYDDDSEDFLPISGATHETITGSFFRHFDQIEVVATAYDGEDEGSSRSSLPVTIDNTPPTTTCAGTDSDACAEIVPNPPSSTDYLTCSVVGYVDVDGDPQGNHVYRWYIGGALEASYTEAVLPSSALSRDEEIRCGITISDGYETGDEVTSESVTVLNGAPSAPTVFISPEKPRPYETLECSYDEAARPDPDGDEVSYTFSWYRGETLEPDYTTSELPADVAVGDEVWSCAVTPTDEFGAEGEPGLASVTFLPLLELTQTAVLSGENYQDTAGYSVAALGDANGDGLNDFAVGAPGFDADISGQTMSNSGSVYVIFGDDSSWEEASSVSMSGASYQGIFAEEQAGQAITGGDFNGDGFGDLVIAAPIYSGSLSRQGRVGFILGGTSGWKNEQPISIASMMLFGSTTNAQFGNPLANVGDINGDGLEDIGLGTYGEGVIYLLFGRESGWKGEHDIDSEADASFVVENSSEDTGMSVASAGDVNGDGLGDLLIGAPSAAGGYGRVYLIFGKAEGWGTAVSLATADYSFDGQASGDSAGGGLAGKTTGVQPLASAGDVDGDGLGDFLVGASHNDSGASEGGRVFLFLGASASEWPAQGDLADADAIYTGDSLNGYAGQVVAGAGDLDRDGYDDYLLAAPSYDAIIDDTTVSDAGSVTLWQGGSEGFYSLPWAYAYDLLYGQDGDYFGGSMAAVGDITADGRMDVIIGAPRASMVASASGGVYVMSGP